jgi:hypothetical protein
LRAIYTELHSKPPTRDAARRIFEEARGTYHPIAAQVVESILRG